MWPERDLRRRFFRRTVSFMVAHGVRAATEVLSRKAFRGLWRSKVGLVVGGWDVVRVYAGGSAGDRRPSNVLSTLKFASKSVHGLPRTSNFIEPACSSTEGTPSQQAGVSKAMERRRSAMTGARIFVGIQRAFRGRSRRKVPLINNQRVRMRQVEKLAPRKEAGCRAT